MSAQNIDSNPLSYLSETQINDLIKRYYLKSPSGSFYERVSDLLEEYKVRLEKGQHIYQFFPAQESEISCFDCKNKKKQAFCARSNNKAKYFCENSDCEHTVLDNDVSIYFQKKADEFNEQVKTFEEKLNLFKNSFKVFCREIMEFQNKMNFSPDEIIDFFLKDL